MTRRPAQRAATGTVAPVPPATRASRPGWRDPRLWLGVLIVAVSVVAGARLLAAADDTVAVWAVAADAGPGAQLSAGDLVAHRVRFADGDDLGRYFSVEDELPGDLRLVRGVSAGELLPRAAIGDAEADADTVELPVAIDAEQVPGSVQAGSVVSVYLLGGRRDAGVPPLEDVTVVDAPALETTFGATTGRRQLVLAVPEAAAAAFLDALGRVDDPLLTVTRRD
ncbi:hypothetical protein [Nocardioides sp. T2.26MG-1]|uniref:hypothetical protein n=1 Tax=Nocardioides sp. T2.26MG-1 TaxID=3041166 RepID=UPI0025419B5A|nr:hypothetical protein [Nocardioides sp. T2.26MG-1]